MYFTISSLMSSSAIICIVQRERSFGAREQAMTIMRASNLVGYLSAEVLLLFDSQRGSKPFKNEPLCYSGYCGARSSFAALSNISPDVVVGEQATFLLLARICLISPSRSLFLMKSMPNAFPMASEISLR